MKFFHGKSYPHPVLRYGSTDYTEAEFQADIDLDRKKGSTELLLTVEFALSDPTLLDLVANGKAAYMAVVKCSKTYSRRCIKSRENTLTGEFEAGELFGQIEISPFLVCEKKLLNFFAPGWHEDYHGLPITIEPGAVLAVDQPREYWIDTAEEQPVGSIFEATIDSSLQDGCWTLDPEGHKVKITLSEADFARFTKAREIVQNTPQQIYILNSVYLPALLQVLHEGDSMAEEGYDRWCWFRSLNCRLEDVRCATLGTDNRDRLKDAQKLLENPFSPLLSLSINSNEELL